jgi:hypothetical protein
MQPEPAYLGKNVGRGRRAVLLDGGLDDGEQVALQRAVMPLGARSQTSYHLVGSVLDGEVDGHGSDCAP